MQNLQLTTALLTPFKNDAVDYISFKKLLDNQLECGINSFVVLGTTQENVLLTDSEQKKVVEFVKSNVGENSNIILGIGNSSTKQTVKKALWGFKVGCEGLLVVSPYYTKSTTVGLEEHFIAVAEATNLPIILYNVPARVGYNIEISTLSKLEKYDNIVALKEASNSLSRAKKIAKKCPSLNLYCGNDNMLFDYQKLPTFAGSISVLSNCVPRLAVSAYNGDRLAKKLFLDLAKLCACEISPVVAKYIAYKLGLISTPLMRLPLTELDEQNRIKVDKLLEKINKHGYL